MEFGQILRDELKRQGKSQRWLAEQLQVSPAAITKYLKGNPSWDVIQRINSVLPLPKAAALLQSGQYLQRYVGNDLVFKDAPTHPEILDNLKSLTLAYQDVLEDPDARADFAALVEAILELTPEQRRGLLLLIQSSDKHTK